MTCFDRIDFDHVQSERFSVFQLLLTNIKTITEEVVVRTGNSAEAGEDQDRQRETETQRWGEG